MTIPKKYKWGDKEYTIFELSNINGISESTIRYRIDKGWSIDRIMNHKPVHHGMTNTKLYNLYKNMVHRCYNPNHKDYKNYHDRGIGVCDEWRNNAKSFLDWALNNGYEQGLSIDRIDNNKGYSPDNCRWATATEQANNRSTSIRLEYKGEIKSLNEIAQLEGISYDKAYKCYVKCKKTRLPRKYLYEGE